MGNNNSVNFQDHKTKEDLQNFMMKIEKDNDILKNKITEYEATAKDTETKLSIFPPMQKYFEAVSECNKPSVVFWLSKKSREDCVQAQMRAFESFAELTGNIITFIKTDEMKKEVGKSSQYLTTILETNKDMFKN